MESGAKLAGFFAAHAVWCISEGETLIPFVGTETADGSRHIHRFAAPNLQDGVQQGRDHLARNPEAAIQAVLIYDGFITLPGGKVDALIVDIRDYPSPSHTLLMALPYRHATSAEGFGVHRPKFLSFEGVKSDDQLIGVAFFQGVGAHEKGAAVWSEHLDESL